MKYLLLFSLLFCTSHADAHSSLTQFDHIHSVNISLDHRKKKRKRIKKKRKRRCKKWARKSYAG